MANWLRDFDTPHLSAPEQPDRHTQTHTHRIVHRKFIMCHSRANARTQMHNVAKHTSTHIHIFNVISVRKRMLASRSLWRPRARWRRKSMRGHITRVRDRALSFCAPRTRCGRCVRVRLMLLSCVSRACMRHIRIICTIALPNMNASRNSLKRRVRCVRCVRGASIQSVMRTILRNTVDAAAVRAHNAFVACACKGKEWRHNTPNSGPHRKD